MITKYPILQLKGVSKYFPGTKALDNVSLDFYEGEVHVLLGENGAGKSTLIKILSGIYIQEEGKIVYKNKDVVFQNVLDARNLGISVVHQELNLCDTLTVSGNVFIGREIAKWGYIDTKSQNKKTKEILSKLNLHINPNELVKNLSIGQQQLVEVAKALSFDSKVLILDEPTSAISSKETELLFAIIKKLKNKGVAIIYISHRMEEFNHIADKVSVLRDGKYIGTRLFKKSSVDELIKMMVGRTVYNDYPERHSKIEDEIVLKVSNFTKNEYFEDINFELKKGEILGVSGLMGAGRTELAKAIIGEYTVDKGKVEVFGKEIKDHTINKMVTKGVAYLTENRRLEGLALNQDVIFNSILASIKEFSNGFAWVNKPATIKKTEENIKLLSIKTPKNETIISSLSGGNQQKVIVGRWLIKKSRILIMDEPTRGIDVNAKTEIYQLIRRLSENGISIMMISSELPELIGMSDRIAIMNRGHITKILDKSSFSQERIMKYATMAF